MYDLNNYRLLEETPRKTAVADVYRAVDLTTGVEVKIDHFYLRLPYLRGARGKADQPERFLREAAEASRLSHPGMARVLHSGESEGRLFVMTELVTGTALPTGVLLGAPRALDLLQQAAAALDYVHAQGALHLDLKPSKLSIDDAGRLRLTGFGITAITRAAYDMMRELLPRDLPTPAYVAPEQILSQTCDAMADRYSLAAIAFEMLSGRTPFHSEDRRTEVFLIMKGERPAAHDVNPALPAEVSAILKRGLAIHPADRFESCAELVFALEAALRAGGLLSVPIAT